MRYLSNNSHNVDDFTIESRSIGNDITDGVEVIARFHRHLQELQVFIHIPVIVWCQATSGLIQAQLVRTVQFIHNTLFLKQGLWHSNENRNNFLREMESKNGNELEMELE